MASSFSVVEIETTTLCNRRCHYCPNSIIKRPRALMAEETFHRIIDSIKVKPFNGRIWLHHYGEPLMDKRLEHLVHATRKALPECTIELYTNGDLLTVDRYMTLWRNGVNKFVISQHSRAPTKTVSNTLSFIRQYIPEMYQVEYLLMYRPDFHVQNRGGLLNLPARRPKRRGGCVLVNRGLTFDYRADAILCCNDFNSSVVFGNIHKASAHDIWKDPFYRSTRTLIAHGAWPYRMCMRCSEGGCGRWWGF